MAQQHQQLTSEAVQSAKWEHVLRLAAETSSGVSVDEMETVMMPIVESCTKDSISSGKIWIFSQAVSHANNQLMAHYLAYRVTKPDAEFRVKLHLIYLMNDVLHHCLRKGAEELKQSFESVAVEMFCSAMKDAANDEDKAKKLNRLIGLWEEKGIFSPYTVEKMKNPEESFASYQERLKEDYADRIADALRPSQQTYENYRQAIKPSS